MTEEQLSALLRLKRFEQPPPGYFDQLLRDVHRRQRSDLIQRPLWKIAVERMQTYFGEHSMSPASFAGAMATLLILGVAAIKFVSPGVIPHSSGGAVELVKVTAPDVQEAPHALALEARASTDRSNSGWESSRPSVPSRQAQRNPRFVIDAIPVTYEPSFSF
jgi:hypothetical protein